MNNKNSGLEEIRNKYFSDEDPKTLSGLARVEGDRFTPIRNSRYDGVGIFNQGTAIENIYSTLEKLTEIAKKASSEDKKCKLENALNAMGKLITESHWVYELQLEGYEKAKKGDYNEFGTTSAFGTEWCRYVEPLFTDHEVGIVKKHLHNIDEIYEKTADYSLEQYKSKFYQHRLNRLINSKMNDAPHSDTRCDLERGKDYLPERWKIDYYLKTHIKDGYTTKDGDIEDIYLGENFGLIPTIVDNVTEPKKYPTGIPEFLKLRKRGKKIKMI